MTKTQSRVISRRDSSDHELISLLYAYISPSFVLGFNRATSVELKTMAYAMALLCGVDHMTVLTVLHMFLFVLHSARLSVLVQRYDAVLLRDTLPAPDCTE